MKENMANTEIEHSEHGSSQEPPMKVEHNTSHDTIEEAHVTFKTWIVVFVCEIVFLDPVSNLLTKEL